MSALALKDEVPPQNFDPQIRVRFCDPGNAIGIWAINSRDGAGPAAGIRITWLANRGEVRVKNMSRKQCGEVQVEVIMYKIIKVLIRASDRGVTYMS